MFRDGVRPLGEEGSSVSTPAEYRQHAAECLRLSGETNDPEAKTNYVSLAQAWVALAGQVEGGLRDVTEAVSRLLPDVPG